MKSSFWTPACDAKHACDLGLPGRYVARGDRRATKFGVVRSYLELEAIKRGIGVAELTRRVMSTVIKDKLVDAVLDDAPLCEAQAPSLVV